MNKNTGGPAFPVENTFSSNGMTLRDYFAAKALQGMLADPTTHCDEDEFFTSFAADIAVNAYMLADAMLEARKA